MWISITRIISGFRCMSLVVVAMVFNKLKRLRFGKSGGLFGLGWIRGRNKSIVWFELLSGLVGRCRDEIASGFQEERFERVVATARADYSCSRALRRRCCRRRLVVSRTITSALIATVSPPLLRHVLFVDADSRLLRFSSPVWCYLTRI